MSVTHELLIIRPHLAQMPKKLGTSKDFLFASLSASLLDGLDLQIRGREGGDGGQGERCTKQW